MVLSGYSDMAGKLGNATRVNITILKNDDPHGVIQFLPDELSVTIKESKGEVIYAGNSFLSELLLYLLPAPTFPHFAFLGQRLTWVSTQEFPEWDSASMMSGGGGWVWKARGISPAKKKWLENMLDRRDGVLCKVPPGSSSSACGP